MANPALTPDEIAEIAKFDLTHKITPWLDKHLILPMLHFHKEVGIYKTEDITRAELNLLSDTNMVDFALEKYDELGEEKPEALTSRRDTVIQQMETAREQLLGYLKILEDEESIKRMNSMKSTSEVCEAFEISLEQLEASVTYAKMTFDAGIYTVCGELLKGYLNMMEKESDRAMTKKSVACIWGSLACLILNSDFAGAAEKIDQLDKYLENTKMPKREVLLQKTWLLHWTLFAIFKSSQANTPQKALESFLSEKSLSIISLSCKHLFRYVCAAFILQKRLRPALKDTVWIIHNETESAEGSYSDPITRFLVKLYTDLDFDGAQLELQECQKVCKADFFLADHWEDFQENARLLIFETYCRIHQCINIDMIAVKLNMTPGEAELWIVKLIQNAKLDARIDSEKRRVVMSKAPPSVYHQVIEKTKNLSFRSTMLLSNLEKRENEKKGVVDHLCH